MSMKKKKGFSRKAFLFALAAVLLIGCSVGGTLAWLTAKTDEVKNTFTVGDINITLAETKMDFKMVPGCTIAKDPKVTVEAGSEECFLFVKLEKSQNFDFFLTYEMADGWTQLTGEGITDTVYYRVVTKDGANSMSKIGEAYSVLKDDKVTVKDTVTKEMMDELKASVATQPTLTFTAYACQLKKDNTTEFTAAEAWAQVSTTTTP